jgi:hypothetical protein
MTDNRANFDELVTHCLHALASNQETLDTILDRYAAGDADLRARLRTALVLTASKGQYEPRPGFVAASRSRLVERIRREQALQAAQPQSLAARLAAFFGYLRQQPRLAVVLVIVIFLVFSASLTGRATLTATAVSIPGDAVYPAKLFLEDSRLAVSVSETGDARLRMQFAGRRLVELDSLLKTQRYQLAVPTLDNYKFQLNEAVRLLQVMVARNAPAAGRLAESFASSVATYQEQLTSLAEKAPVDLQPNFSLALAVSQNGSIAVQDVLDQVDRLQMLTSTQTATPSLTVSPVDPSPEMELTATGTPAVTAIPSSTNVGPTPTEILATSTPLRVEIISTPVPTDDEEEVIPTKKPTKTPKTLPDPTRRPPHPTPKP